MEAFLSFIIISVIVLYLAGQLGKWLLRRWITRKQREFAQKFGEQAGGFSGQYTWYSGRSQGKQPPKREGEIKVQRTVKKQKKASRQVGDYVDFEEINE